MTDILPEVPGEWTIYDPATGRIIMGFHGNFEMMLLNKPEGAAHTSGFGRPDLDYVQEDEVLPRPEFPIDLGGPLPVNVTRTITLPVGTQVWANGEDYGVPADGQLQLVSSEPAQHQIRLCAWPYLDFNGTLQVVA